jgi:hypothetical protein
MIYIYICIIVIYIYVYIYIHRTGWSHMNRLGFLECTECTEHFHENVLYLNSTPSTGKLRRRKCRQRRTAAHLLKRSSGPKPQFLTGHSSANGDQARWPEGNCVPRVYTSFQWTSDGDMLCSSRTDQFMYAPVFQLWCLPGKFAGWCAQGMTSHRSSIFKGCCNRVRACPTWFLQQLSKKIHTW